MKTIGTTGRQLRRIVRYQSWILAGVGIPIGLLLGYGAERDAEKEEKKPERKSNFSHGGGKSAEE